MIHGTGYGAHVTGDRSRMEHAVDHYNSGTLKLHVYIDFLDKNLDYTEAMVFLVHDYKPHDLVVVPRWMLSS